MNIAYLNSPAYDYLTASLIEGLLELGHKVYTSENSNYGIFLSKKEFIEKANMSDLLIIGSNRNVRYDYLKYIRSDKSVYVDGSDSSFLELNFKFPINLIFKRECLNRLNLQSSLIFPLPFAAEKRYFNSQFKDKDIDISFLASNNNFLRDSIKTILDNKFHANSFTEHTGEISYSYSSGLPHENPVYFDVLRRSKIVINVPGRGWDCGRYWEAISNRATVITYKLEIEIPDPFVENSQILSFNTLEQLEEQIEFCLNNPDIIEKMSEEAYNHLIQFHTTSKRAEYFLKIIDTNYRPDVFFNSEKNIIKERPNTNLFNRIKGSISSRFQF
jgi:hypothetical protein